MEQKPKYLLNYPFWEQNKNKQLKNGEECHSWINKVQVYCFYRLGPTFQHCILGNGKPEASELGKELGKKQNKTNSVFFPIPNYVFKISWNQNVLFPNSLHSSELCPTSLHLLALNSTGAAECRKCLGWGPRSRGGGGGGRPCFTDKGKQSGLLSTGQLEWRSLSTTLSEHARGSQPGKSNMRIQITSPAPRQTNSDTLPNVSGSRK